MPYIQIEKRGQIDVYVRKLAASIRDIGSLNYAITRLLLETNPRPSYAAAVSVMGTLSCVATEWYRRWVSPYEDIKRRENGDVFTAVKMEENDDAY